MGVGRKFVPETGNLSSLYLPGVACVRVCGIICMLTSCCLCFQVYIYIQRAARSPSWPFRTTVDRSKQTPPGSDFPLGPVVHRLGHPSLGTCTTQRSPPTKVAGYRTGTFFRKSGQQRRVLATTSYNNCNRSIIDTSHTPCRKEDIFLKDTHSPPTPYPPAPLDLSVPWSQLDTLLFHR